MKEAEGRKRVRTAVWAGLGGLLSSILTTLLRNQLPFEYAGLVFLACVGTAWLLAKWRSYQRSMLGWRDVMGFLFIGVVAPWICLGCYLLVDRLIGTTGFVPDARVLSTSVGNLAGIVAAVFLWAFCSATFVKLFAGKWDKQLVWRSLLAGALVCVVALVANGIPFNGHPVIPFVGTFIVGQQVLSGILIGASLDRQFSTKFDTAKASAPG